MARKATTSTLLRVRRILLLGLVLFVGALVALYMFGRRPSDDPTDLGPQQGPEGDGAIIVGRDYRQEVTEDGERLFEIEADTLLSNEKDLVILEGVRVIMLRDDGNEYTIEAQRGRYNYELNEAKLTGEVILTSSDGLRLETEGIETRRRGKIVVSTAPVDLFMSGAYEGEAERLEVNFIRNRILLAGGVELRSRPGRYPRSTLRARRAVFFRDTHNFLAEGRVILVREEDRLQARRLSVNFDETDSKILFVNATWEVVGTLAQLDSNGLPSQATIRGDRLSVIFNEATSDPERLELGAPDRGTAQLAVTDPTGLRRSMLADYLWADFVEGSLRHAQGVGGVTIEETLSFAPDLSLRQLCSETAEAIYGAGGSLQSLVLAGDVTYGEPELQAGGDELKSDGASGEVDLVGQLAWVASPEGKLMAPRIHLDRTSGRAQALGGVRAEMVSGSTSTNLDLAEDPELPVQIEAVQAEWVREPPSFEFQQNVRAWQGENFLISQTLGIEDDEMVASGGVRSVWHKRTPLAADPGSEEDPTPVSISSTNMRYSPDEGRLVYQGNAAIVQGERSMRCPLLELELNDAEQFERMYCEGGTQITDGDAGSTITGIAAIYNASASKVKVLGDPVRINQGTGGSISSRLVVYDFETAIAEIDSVKDEDADLFLTSSEYFQQFGQQFGFPAAPVGVTEPGTPIDGPEPTVEGDAGAEGLEESTEAVDGDGSETGENE